MSIIYFYFYYLYLFLMLISDGVSHQPIACVCGLKLLIRDQPSVKSVEVSQVVKWFLERRIDVLMSYCLLVNIDKRIILKRFDALIIKKPPIIGRLNNF